MTDEIAILAGGCFWGAQDLLRRYDGVLSTRVGYCGGTNRFATYRDHGTHAEAVEIVFDPSRLSFRQLLEFFFQIHDPADQSRRVQLSLRETPLETPEAQADPSARLTTASRARRGG